MNPALSLVLKSDIREIPGMNDSLSRYLSDEGVPDNEILDIQLAVEEAITNTIHHGYREKPGEISISCTVQPETIEIVIRDAAVPFNPLTLPPPDIHASAEDRPIGGLGVMLIRNLMQDVRYRFEGGQNILTLVKARNGPGPEDEEPA
ncbi:MAG: ATP-binding protein [Methanoregulaceae archaeon]